MGSMVAETAGPSLTLHEEGEPEARERSGARCDLWSVECGMWSENTTEMSFSRYPVIPLLR